MKFLLWMDVLQRAGACLGEVTCLYNHRTFALTRQVLGFWEYLDRAHPGADYSGMGEEEIGALYVASHAAPCTASAAALRPYAEAVERDGWFHPASRRLLDIWQEQYRVIGLLDPLLGRRPVESLGEEEVVGHLLDAGLCLDLRHWGGPVYLDLSAHGLPLRQLVDAGGRPNFLMCALKELLPLASRHDRVVLASDADLSPDYRLLARTLTHFGGRVSHLPVTRVPIAGVTASSRHGGWQGYTLGALIDRFVPEHGPDAFRLGLRLYLVAGLGKGSGQSFSDDHLRRQLARAARLLAQAGPASPAAGPSPALCEFLLTRTAPEGYVDPYRLTSSLLDRHRSVPLPELLGTVYP
ncbi:hypothetical protein [Sphaerisporangium sp. TRM90804]|uniref:hypothetical protein n=1 Tax=Sphaerisporangium sp. TRM90804 TaxID=3031113 RepID=UPI002447EC5E|nr:hypothetical protein [Sphaerisporangium sp. TRM90804]MDH2429625.1 hypothetical protein [Sphaerisporangium sp. TRM90804]